MITNTSTKPRPSRLTPTELTELQQQATVVSVLKKAGILFTAIPNGHVRSKRQSIQGFQEGVQAGAPDLLIFTPPPNQPQSVGVALEMKRATASMHDVRPEQAKWLQALGSVGWATVVGFGAVDAVAKLRALGYVLSLSPFALVAPAALLALTRPAGSMGWL